MKSLHQKGDTIVEVLIAIAITSLVLTGAFTSARESSLGNRKSQERVESLKVAEEQLERLRELASVPGNQFTGGAPNNMCVRTTSSPSWYASSTGLSNNFSDSGAHPPACTRTFASGGVSYYPIIVRSGPAGNYTFKIHVRWDKVGGGGVEEVTLAYRSNL